MAFLFLPPISVGVNSYRKRQAVLGPSGHWSQNDVDTTSFYMHVPAGSNISFPLRVDCIVQGLYS